MTYPPTDPGSTPPPQDWSAPPPYQRPPSNPVPPAVPEWNQPAPSPGGSNSTLIVTVFSVLILALIAVVVVVVVVFPSGDTEQADVPTGSQTLDAKLVYGDGPVEVDVYLDFSCDHCATFDLQYHDRLVQEIDAGTITLAFHPVAMLDSYSLDEYSTRAGAASGCAAAEGKFMEYAHVLAANFPDLPDGSLSDTELVVLGDEVPLSDGFGDCVMEGTYTGWIGQTSHQAQADGVGAIPHVLIDGSPLSDPIVDFGPELDAALTG